MIDYDDEERMLSLSRTTLLKDVGVYRITITLYDEFENEKKYFVLVEVLNSYGLSMIFDDPDDGPEE